ncbi:MAG: ParA family protein [Planctomycetota bacterium]
MPRTLTVASQKGGVGKTTTTVNLGCCLGQAGRSVLIVDLDPQANATSGVGLERDDPEVSALRALLDGDDLEPAILDAPTPNVRVLPASGDASDLDLLQDLIAHSPERLRETLSRSTEDYEYVLIDCPPTLRGPPTIALHLSDAVIIPVQCEYYAMEGLSQILPVVREIQESANPALAIEGLLLTMFSPELELSRDVASEIRQYFGDVAFRAVIPRDVTLAEAASHGEPAIRYSPLSRGAWSYVELAREVIENGEA